MYFHSVSCVNMYFMFFPTARGSSNMFVCHVAVEKGLGKGVERGLKCVLYYINSSK